MSEPISQERREAGRAVMLDRARGFLKLCEEQIAYYDSLVETWDKAPRDLPPGLAVMEIVRVQQLRKKAAEDVEYYKAYLDLIPDEWALFDRFRTEAHNMEIAAGRAWSEGYEDGWQAAVDQIQPELEHR